MKAFPSFLKVGAALFLFLLVISITTAQARKAKEGDAQDDPRILVTAVSASSGSITVEYMTNKVTHTYTIDGATIITINGNPGKISGIAAGMQVRDSVERDSSTLDSISVGPADPAPAGSEGKTQDKG
jgi:hypothetical protein